MSWEFPAVSQTRIDFWKEPQYTRKGMFIFTALFGAFGLHHLLFRSPQTWILFFLANIFSLGYFYWYDLIQLWYTPIEELNQFGLHSPIGPLGLAQGMFDYIPVYPNSSAPLQGGSVESTGAPNPWWFFLYTLLLPLQPLAKYIAGDSGYAITSLLSLVVIPFGWLFSLFMMGSEYFNLFFRPKQVFDEGIQRIFPFTSVWLDQSGHSKRLTGKEQVEDKNDKGCSTSERDGFFATLIKNLLSALLPFIRFLIPPEVTLAIESAIQTKELVVDKALNVVNKGTKVAAQVGKLATNIPQAATESLGKLENIATNPQALLKGGSRTNEINYWDYAAIGGIGAVLGAGFLLHTGRSFQNAVHRVNGTSDEPPNT